ncbi:hypothetical protein [Bradyrhizobium sp. STM 3562]|uniref:hypothetical protein n=1 Tax=Bradyrhizobium sp. STM 3562 TaxID=578924 RepID=UPI00388DFA54
MNETAIFGDKSAEQARTRRDAQLAVICASFGPGGPLASTVTNILLAVGAISAICYALVNRHERRRANRQLSRDRSGSDGGDTGPSAGDDGRTISSWFGGHHSSCDSSGHPGDSGDGGSCGSEGGGGGGGGGGGD